MRGVMGENRELSIPGVQCSIESGELDTISPIESSLRCEVDERLGDGIGRQELGDAEEIGDTGTGEKRLLLCRPTGLLSDTTCCALSPLMLPPWKCGKGAAVAKFALSSRRLWLRKSSSVIMR